MSEDMWGPITALLCTVSMLIGYLSGWRETRVDERIVAIEEWHRHVQSAMFVARRTLPDEQDTQETRR